MKKPLENQLINKRFSALGGGYHNKEFATMMESIGLMPSDTGKEGGKKTGQKMADYAIEGGDFIKASEVLFEKEFFKDLFLQINPTLLGAINDNTNLFEQISNLILLQETSKPTKPKSKIKYSCSCSNVWGKPNLLIKCGTCSEDFKPNE